MKIDKNKIILLMCKQKQTYQDMADIMGIPKQRFRNILWQSALHDVQLRTLFKLTDALKCAPEEIIADDDGSRELKLSKNKVVHRMATLNLTYETFGKKVGASKQAVSCVLNSSKNGLDIICKYAKVLECNATDILED